MYKRRFKESIDNEEIEDAISNMDIEDYIDDYKGKGSIGRVTGYVISSDKIDSVRKKLKSARVSFDIDSYGRDYIIY